MRGQQAKGNRAAGWVGVCVGCMERDLREIGEVGEGKGNDEDEKKKEGGAERMPCLQWKKEVP